MTKQVTNIKTLLLVMLAVTVSLLPAGCFKKVSNDTLFIIKPNLQVESGGELTLADGAVACAWFNRTDLWEIKSYSDAVEHLLTNTETGSVEAAEPDAVSTPAETEGREGLLELETRSQWVLLLVVYPEAEMYAWRVFETGVNLSPTYLTVQFRTWKTDSYVDSGWTVGVNKHKEPEGSLE